MVWAGSWFRQAEGDVHGGVEVQKLQRDQALVVIHGQHGVELALRCVPENRVWHGGTGENGHS